MRDLHAVIPILDRRIFSSLKQQALLFDKFYVSAVDEDVLEPHEVKDCEFLQEQRVLDHIGTIIPLDEPPAALDDETAMLGAAGLLIAGIAHVTPWLWKVINPKHEDFGDWKKLQDGSVDFLFDLVARVWATELANKNPAIDALPICRLELPEELAAESGLHGIQQNVLNVAFANLPAPDKGTS